MREVAVTEGDKVEVQAKLGWQVNTWAVGDLVKVMSEVTEEEIDAQMDPEKYVGRAPSQVTEFLRDEIAPLLAKYPDEMIEAELNV